MVAPIDLLHQGRKDELWHMCCGFIDLSLEQFMSIQERLLLEQIEMLKDCELGRKVMRGAMPESVEEFREQVPLTSYADYCPELAQKREDVLPAKVAQWVRTSGYTGKYDVKWVPMTEDFVAECEKVCGALALFALCDGRGDASRLKQHMKILFTVGPPSYATGAIGEFVRRATNCEFLPCNGHEDISFTEKVKLGFQEALYRGLDGFGGLPSVLVAVGEQLKQQSGKMDTRFLLAHPNALFRMTMGLVRSKLARRPMLPKDIWAVKGILGGGTDTAIFQKRVEELWGKCPLELYAGTEGCVYATQTWDFEGMTFVPNLNFFEFIPEREHFKWQLDHSYQPKTILLDEVKAGEKYEVVITNLHGGILTRHRIGDMIRISSLRNERLDIDIPQMVFHSRADDLIDITGFGHLTEKLIWEAIENSGIPYADWAARKGVLADRPVLHLYIEPTSDYVGSEKAAAEAIYEELLKLDSVHHYNIYSAYGDPQTVLGLKPVQVTFLPRGAFFNYILQREAEGAEMGHLKPAHINPSDEVLSLLGAPEVVVEAAPATEAERAAAR